ncbi:uncharacterized protein TNCV_4877921 [Trichonephila clavipes]|nr:uncharacterized protein TNCV_4877921 [Trichonephila clavipes]
MIIGHDYLPAHLFKIGLADSTICPVCKSGPMTGEHLSDCPALLHVLSQDNCGVLLLARVTYTLYWIARRLMSENSSHINSRETVTPPLADRTIFSNGQVSELTLICRAPGTRYHHENTIVRHRYGGAGWLVWGGIILCFRTDLHVQSVTMTGHIYRDVILEQHVRLFRGAMGAEFLFMEDNARPHRANVVDECLQS